MKHYKLCCYVPEQALEKVKQVLFDAGAGKIGDYDHCCWQTLGQGQFRPLLGSSPFIGKVNEVEFVAEYKIEMIVEGAALKAAVMALKLAHPYETPAYDIWPLQEME